MADPPLTVAARLAAEDARGFAKARYQVNALDTEARRRKAAAAKLAGESLESSPPPPPPLEAVPGPARVGGMSMGRAMLAIREAGVRALISVVRADGVAQSAGSEDHTPALRRAVLCVLEAIGSGGTGAAEAGPETVRSLLMWPASEAVSTEALASGRRKQGSGKSRRRKSGKRRDRASEPLLCVGLLLRAAMLRYGLGAADSICAVLNAADDAASALLVCDALIAAGRLADAAAVEVQRERVAATIGQRGWFEAIDGETAQQLAASACALVMASGEHPTRLAVAAAQLVDRLCGSRRCAVGCGHAGTCAAAARRAVVDAAGQWVQDSNPLATAGLAVAAHCCGAGLDAATSLGRRLWRVVQVLVGGPKGGRRLGSADLPAIEPQPCPAAAWAVACAEWAVGSGGDETTAEEIVLAALGPPRPCRNGGDGKLLMRCATAVLEHVSLHPGFAFELAHSPTADAVVAACLEAEIGDPFMADAASNVVASMAVARPRLALGVVGQAGRFGNPIAQLRAAAALVSAVLRMEAADVLLLGEVGVVATAAALVAVTGTVADDDNDTVAPTFTEEFVGGGGDEEILARLGEQLMAALPLSMIRVWLQAAAGAGDDQVAMGGRGVRLAAVSCVLRSHPGAAELLVGAVGALTDQGEGNDNNSGGDGDNNSGGDMVLQCAPFASVETQVITMGAVLDLLWAADRGAQAGLVRWINGALSASGWCGPAVVAAVASHACTRLVSLGAGSGVAAGSDDDGGDDADAPPALLPLLVLKMLPIDAWRDGRSDLSDDARDILLTFAACPDGSVNWDVSRLAAVVVAREWPAGSEVLLAAGEAALSAGAWESVDRSLMYAASGLRAGGWEAAVGAAPVLAPWTRLAVCACIVNPTTGGAGNSKASSGPSIETLRRGALELLSLVVEHYGGFDSSRAALDRPGCALVALLCESDATAAEPWVGDLAGPKRGLRVRHALANAVAITCRRLLAVHEAQPGAAPVPPLSPLLIRLCTALCRASDGGGTGDEGASHMALAAGLGQALFNAAYLARKTDPSGGGVLYATAGLSKGLEAACLATLEAAEAADARHRQTGLQLFGLLVGDGQSVSDALLATVGRMGTGDPDPSLRALASQLYALAPK